MARKGHGFVCNNVGCKARVFRIRKQLNTVFDLLGGENEGTDKRVKTFFTPMCFAFVRFSP